MENNVIKDGFVSFLGYKTYYRIVNPCGKKVPLIICHGGPGSTHNSYEVLDDMAFQEDRPIVRYDQLGCGLSSLSSPHTYLWNKETWMDELNNLREKLGLKKIHLRGHSWGGRLVLLYLLDRKPDGVLSVTLSSTLSSASLWKEETHHLLSFLPSYEKEALLKAEEAMDFSSLEYHNAYEDYYHLFIGGPFVKGVDPECLTREKIQGTEAYLTAWGPCEFAPTGTLKDYEVTSRRKEITCPVLLISGERDESTPYQNKVRFDSLLNAREKKWCLYPDCPHRTYVYQKKKFEEDLFSFLNEHDREVSKND